MTAALLASPAPRRAAYPPCASVQSDASLVSSLAETLEKDGCVRLPRLLTDDVLHEMQHVFASRLRHLRWNNCDGYERGEPMRLMVQDVLTLAQGFVDLAVHPLVTAVLDEYLGPNYSLCEAKGWKSLPTKRDFHGWHSDKWYDQTKITDRIPREVKLAFYLSDVRSGAFQYLKGTHGLDAPHHVGRDEAARLPLEHLEELLGPAGTAVLFDTSGIHRQGTPILEPRQAIFYNYHDSAIPLQQEDIEYYRYHPLLLNAAFLGDMSCETMRILGFGDQTHYQAGFARRSSHPWLHGAATAFHSMKLWMEEWSNRLVAKATRAFGHKA